MKPQDDNFDFSLRLLWSLFEAKPTPEEAQLLDNAEVRQLTDEALRSTAESQPDFVVKTLSYEKIFNLDISIAELIENHGEELMLCFVVSIPLSHGFASFSKEEINSATLVPIPCVSVSQQDEPKSKGLIIFALPIHLIPGGAIEALGEMIKIRIWIDFIKNSGVPISGGETNNHNQQWGVQ